MDELIPRIFHGIKKYELNFYGSLKIRNIIKHVKISPANNLSTSSFDFFFFETADNVAHTRQISGNFWITMSGNIGKASIKIKMH